MVKNYSQFLLTQLLLKLHGNPSKVLLGAYGISLSPVSCVCYMEKLTLNTKKTQY